MTPEGMMRLKQAAERAVEALYQMRELPEFYGGVQTAKGTIRRNDIKAMEYQIEHIKWAMEKALEASRH